MTRLCRISKTARAQSGQNGGVLTLVALCLAVIVGIVGLAIDFNISLGGNTDQQQLANSLASGAIEAYLSNATGSQSERIASARNRIIAIAQLPKNRPIYQSFLSNPNEPVNLCLKTSPDSACAESDQGAIIPGYWHNKYDETSTLDPCNGASNSPCFIPGDGSASDLTGFQVELAQSSSSSMKTIFLGLFGIKTLRTKAVATAAVIPRHIVISVDLSPSIEGTTHVSGAGTDLNKRRRSAYKLAPGITCNPDHTPNPDPCTIAGDPSEVPHSPCPGIAHSAHEHYDVMWAGTPDTPNPASLNPDFWRDSVKKHFKSDYECWDVADDGNGPAHYLIDTYQNLSPAPGEPFYQGPEPLTTILKSIAQALEVIKARKNAGDRVQLSFFDTTVLANRELPYLPDSATDSFSLARIADDDPNFQEIKRMLDPANLSARITQHAIFPRINPLISAASRDPWAYQQGGVFTNIPYATKRAASALTRNNNTYARRNVVMFSDFIPNCKVESWEGEEPWCINDWSVASGAIFGTWNSVIEKYYVKTNKIAFNPILIGDYVRPHTTLPLNGLGTGCLWDENVIRMTVPGPLTNGNASPYSYVNNYGGECREPRIAGAGCDDFNANPPDSYYYRPNYFYGPALDTGGAWGVIRPCCQTYNAAHPYPQGQCGDVKPLLDEGCVREDSSLRSATDPINWGCPLNDAGHCKLGFSWRYDWTDIDVDPNQPGDQNPYLDNQGRLICDPGGRTEAQQMVDYMTKIMGSNSIVLVPTTSHFTQ